LETATSAPDSRAATSEAGPEVSAAREDSEVPVDLEAREDSKDPVDLQVRDLEDPEVPDPLRLTSPASSESDLEPTPARLPLPTVRPFRPNFQDFYRWTHPQRQHQIRLSL
jgi:hypothetical protein